MENKKKVLWGLTGSVASVLTSKITNEAPCRYDVKFVATKCARSFFHLSHVDPHSKLYLEKDEWEWTEDKNQTTQMKEQVTKRYYTSIRTIWQKEDPVLHIELRDWADVLVIAPLTANTLAKMANGICDNLLTSIVRAWPREKPMVIAPAMNTVMWESPFTKEHINKLSNIYNLKVAWPVEKELACGDHGLGAMANLDTIYEKIDNAFQWISPVSECNGIPVGKHPGAFGVQRKYSKHCGVDLYVKDNVTVHAMEPGKIVAIEPFTGAQDNSPWWNNTECVLIRGHSGRTICYGEITTSNLNPPLRVGQFVTRGQYIGNVIPVLKEGKERPDIPGHSRCMLHIELYKNKTNVPSDGWDKTKDIVGLTDPTPFLLDFSNGNFKKLEMTENK